MYHSASIYSRYSDNLFFNLGSLLNVALINNARHSITGVLAFADRQFAQVLEGPEAAVDSLFARIRADWRHSDVTLVLREPCRERAFPTWSMGYVGFEANLQPMFDSLAGRNGVQAEPLRMIRDLSGMVEPPVQRAMHG